MAPTSPRAEAALRVEAPALWKRNVRSRFVTLATGKSNGRLGRSGRRGGSGSGRTHHS